MHLILNTSQQVYNSQRSAIVKWQVSLIKPSSVRNLFRDFNCTCSSVSVKVKKDDVYFLKSWPRIWTSLIANGNRTEKSGCFQHFVRTSKTTVWPIKQMMPVLSSQIAPMTALITYTVGGKMRRLGKVLATYLLSLIWRGQENKVINTASHGYLWFHAKTMLF